MHGMDEWRIAEIGMANHAVRRDVCINGGDGFTANAIPSCFVVSSCIVYVRKPVSSWTNGYSTLNTKTVHKLLVRCVLSACTISACHIMQKIENRSEYSFARQEWSRDAMLFWKRGVIVRVVGSTNGVGFFKMRVVFLLFDSYQNYWKNKVWA